MTILCLSLLLLKNNEMFKRFKEVLRIASSPSVQFLTAYTFAGSGSVTYTMFGFAACKFAICMFLPPIMIKVVLKCAWMSRFKCLI